MNVPFKCPHCNATIRLRPIGATPVIASIEFVCCIAIALVMGVRNAVAVTLLALLFLVTLNLVIVLISPANIEVYSPEQTECKEETFTRLIIPR